MDRSEPPKPKPKPKPKQPTDPAEAEREAPGIPTKSELSTPVGSADEPDARAGVASPTLQQSQSLGGMLTDFSKEEPGPAINSGGGGGDGGDETPSASASEPAASFSMTLAISPSDTSKLFGASEMFNRQIAGLRRRGERDLPRLLAAAARRTRHRLVESLLSHRSERDGGGGDRWDARAGLLFLLDSDKSIKLLAAFDLLSGTGGAAPGGGASVDDGEAPGSDGEIDRGESGAAEGEPLKDLNEELADRLIKEDATTSKLLDRRGAETLFSSVLTAISICVHGNDEEENAVGDRGGGKTEEGAAPAPEARDKSPSESDPDKSPSPAPATGDWKRSDKTHSEIMEIATFAADNLMEFAIEEMEKSKEANNNNINSNNNNNNTSSSSSAEQTMVSFDTFGKWYNAGGFSLVPWLELLDLSKWDHHHASRTTDASQSSCKRPKRETRAPRRGGSPTAPFSAAAAAGDPEAEPSPPHSTYGIRSFSAIFGEKNESRTVVSFDFSGSADPSSSSEGFQIDIAEENLVMLRNLVRRTGLAEMSPQHVERAMMKHARLERKKGEAILVISRSQYNKFIRSVVPKEASDRFDPEEIQNFSNYFTNFFTCFDYSWSDLKKDEVNARELMVGFSFLCAGNKSSKLAAAYEMLDAEKNGYLTQRGLMSYLRSYLTMLAGISLLSSSKKNTHQIRKKLLSERRHDAFVAVENGAKWTLGHFLRAFEMEVLQNHRGNTTRSNAVTFEDFAKWYTDGGYKIAPWLELLDLNKFLSLIKDAEQNNGGGYGSAAAEVLFTFPLANSRSLVVLRDDAVYVRSVVAELGLLSLTSQDIWTALYDGVASSLAGAKGSEAKTTVSASVEVDQATFVQCMVRVLTRTNKQKQNAQRAKSEETLKNLFLSFDMLQNNRVALNQLMCGLTLLCGGKKSSKLVFAFGLFGSDGSKNGKKKPSLGHQDFFFFFRSFLIVMFSCCNQSLDLSADEVSKYISDTATLVSDDVMGYWRNKKVNKVVFDQFSEWYNEGGYEIIPWLELLDLNKWVLADQPTTQQTATTQPVPPPPQQMPGTPGPSIYTMDAVRTPAAHTPGMVDTPASFGASPNPEAFRALLASPKYQNGFPPPPDGDPFFDLDMSAVDAEVDEMDFILQNDSAGADHMAFDDDNAAADPSPQKEEQNALKFHLFSNDHHRGYIISIRPNEVSLLHNIVTKTGLCQADSSTVCNFILSEAKTSRPNNIRTLSKRAFHAAMSKVCQQMRQSLSTPMPSSTQSELSAFLDKLFISFDQPKTGSVNALEIACGVTVLCGGRKSDKLEHVFELFDEDKDALLSQQDVARFIQSFLVVLMSISSSISLLDGGACTNDSSTITRAIETGSEWASSQVFEALKPLSGKVCFDDFADWYTKGGYQSIPWLELLDLNKWVLGETT